MTRYEDLLKKAENCYATSMKVRGFMRTVWQMKERQLREIIENLSIDQASVKVRNNG